MNQFFQVEGEEKIFAIGDCCNVQEQKMSAMAKFQASHVIQNIINHNLKKDMKPYTPHGPLMVVPIGP